jgi:hypothetical protein
MPGGEALFPDKATSAFTRVFDALWRVERHAAEPGSLQAIAGLCLAIPVLRRTAFAMRRAREK